LHSAELAIFGRFHAIDGKDEMLAAEFRDTETRVRTEPGCLFIKFYRSTLNPRVFWLHARWTDEEAFNGHVILDTTQRFIDRLQGGLIEHTFEVTRTRAIQ
jgi:quinol monooxygenase YgiN